LAPATITAPPPATAQEHGCCGQCGNKPATESHGRGGSLGFEKPRQVPIQQRLFYGLATRVFGIGSRVAGWHIFKPKIPIGVNFGGSCNGRCWYTLWPFGLFCGHLVYIFCGHLLYFMVNRFNFPVLVCCAKKNLATQIGSFLMGEKIESGQDTCRDAVLICYKHISH
jgi:hypothetical protein